MPKPNNFGTMGEVNTTLSSDFTPPDIKKKKDADLPQIAGMCPGRKIGKPVETDVIPVINKGFPSRKPGGNFSTGGKIACKGSNEPSAPHPDHNKLIGERAAKIYNSASPTELRTPGDQKRALDRAESEYWKETEKGFDNLEEKAFNTIKAGRAAKKTRNIVDQLDRGMDSFREPSQIIGFTVPRKGSHPIIDAFGKKRDKYNYANEYLSAKMNDKPLPFKGYDDLTVKTINPRKALNAYKKTRELGEDVVWDAKQAWERRLRSHPDTAPIMEDAAKKLAHRSDKYSTASGKMREGAQRGGLRTDKGFDDIEIKSLKDKVTAGAVGLTGGYVGSEIANRTQDARRHAENKQLTKEFEMADRGSASFIEMKEFMNADFVEKGGTSPETLPNEKGGDAAEQDKLTDVMNKKQPPKGGIKTEEPDLTMDPEVQMVADKAEDDITSGYVGDTQGAKVGKGFAAFNDLVAKGMVADVNINRYNVHDSVEKINEAADVTLKGCSNEGKKKAPPWLKTGK